MLAKISLALSFFLLIGCGLPLVTIYQLDVKHQKAHPNKVVSYDNENCVMVIEAQESIPLSEAHGFFCLSPEDTGKWKAHAQSECKSKNELRKALDENSKLRAALSACRGR